MYVCNNTNLSHSRICFTFMVYNVLLSLMSHSPSYMYLCELRRPMYMYVYVCQMYMYMCTRTCTRTCTHERVYHIHVYMNVYHMHKNMSFFSFIPFRPRPLDHTRTDPVYNRDAQIVEICHPSQILLPSLIYGLRNQQLSMSLILLQPQRCWHCRS